MKKMMAVLLAVVLVMTLSLSVMAAPSDFVPSAEIKPAPGIVDQPTEDGTPAVGVIIMPDGTIIPVPSDAIIITPLEGADDAVPPSIGDALDNSFDDVNNASSLEDLIDSLQDILDQIANGVSADNLVITDMFHIYLTDEYAKYLDEGGKLQLILRAPAGVLMTFADINGVWSALFGDSFIDNGDGTYTLIISDIGTYAFVKDAGKVDVDPDAPGVSSPTTGDKTTLYIVIGSVLMLAAIVFAYAAKKQKA